MNERRQEAFEILKIMAPSLNLVPVPENTGRDPKGVRDQVFRNFVTIKCVLDVIEKGLVYWETRHHPEDWDTRHHPEEAQKHHQ